MANHESALKRHRQSIKRRNRNKVAKSTVRGAIRKVRSSAESGDAAVAKEDLRMAEKLLAKAAAKGIIPKRTASRNVSRLARKVVKSPTAK